MRLAQLQRALAASLVGNAAAPAPGGCDPREIDGARRALEEKRRRAVAHLLPRLRRMLGRRWHERFHEHAGTYAPCGLLYHVDDAWAFAGSLADAREPALRAAARDDLLALRLRYVRRRGNAGAGRIRERRAPLVAIARTGRVALIVRLPGAGGGVWTIPLASA